MKKIIYFYVFLITTLGITNTYGQVQFTEYFNYGNSVGDLTLLGTNWVGHSGSGTPVQYIPTSLSFDGYNFSLGGAAAFTNGAGSRQDVNKPLNNFSSGTIYASFLYKVGTVTGAGDYNIHFFNPPAGASTGAFVGKLFTKPSSTSGVDFGVTKSLSGVNYGDDDQVPFGQTVLIVLKYTFVGGSLNDAFDLFVIKNTVPSTEPSPNASAAGSDGDILSIGGIAIRQGSTGTSVITVDGIRVANTWYEAVLGSPAKSITGFTLQGGYIGSIAGSSIAVTVPYGTSLSSLSVAGIISDYASIAPSFDTPQDFSSLVNYTVTAEDLSTQVYDVTVNTIPASTEALITDFSLQGVNAAINGLVINVTVPSSIVLSSVTAAGNISTFATINPDFSLVTDFSSPVLLTVTAQNLSTINIYTVTAVNAIDPSSANSITGFSLQGGYIGTVSGTTIALTVPFGTSLTNLSATGVISPAASIAPSLSTLLNYAVAQVFTVTAENLTSVGFYTVTVTTLPYVAPPSVVETFSVYPTVSGWSIYTPKSLSNWILEVTTATSRMVANGYGSAGNSPMESWLITPKLSFVGANLGVGYKIDFSYADAGTAKPAQVLYSTNYSGSGPVSLAGWNVIADDYALVTATGFKNFTTSGIGYIAFKYSASSPGSAIRWRLDDVTISGASIFTPTLAGFVFNYELANPPALTLSGITPLGYVRNSVSPSTGLSTIPSSLTFTIAGQLLGKNIAANVGLSGGVQFSIVDATGANTIRIPNSVYAPLTAAGTFLTEGNSVTIAGTLGQNASLSQFVVSSVVAVDNSVKLRPAPLDVTVINESVEAKLIRVVALVDSTSWNAAPSGNGMNVNSTINGVVYVVRVYAAVNDLFGKSFTKLFGRDNKVASLTIVGLGGQFSNTPASNNGYQIAPYSYADIQFPSPKSGENSIVSFQYLPQAGLSTSAIGTITGNTINVTVPFGTTVTGLIPAIGVSALASINPASGVAPTYINVDPQYFVNYVVTAENGLTKGYQLVVSVGEPTNTTLSGENAILSFVYYPQTAAGLNTTVTGSITGNNIYVTLPSEVTVAGLVPTIIISPKATLTTVSELVYKVTSESGSSALYSLNIGYIVSVTGVSEFETANAFEVYPNPTSASFNIAAKAGLSFEIYNTLGVKVFETTALADVTSVDALTAKGIYLVKVKGSSISKRIVIE